MNAAVPAWHLTDTVVVDRPAWMPAAIGSGRGEARRLAELLERNHCFMLRSANPIADMTLLGDVVDAYKHAELSNQARLVHSSRVTVVIGSGWGEMHYGEGNYGGLDQVIVLTDNGTKKRALSAILQNVIDMWRAAMGLPQEPIGR
jgi:3-oxoacyl-(acyl-carrier-protein) synthase